MTSTTTAFRSVFSYLITKARSEGRQLSEADIATMRKQASKNPSAGKSQRARTSRFS